MGYIRVDVAGVNEEKVEQLRKYLNDNSLNWTED